MFSGQRFRNQINNLWFDKIIGQIDKWKVEFLAQEFRQVFLADQPFFDKRFTQRLSVHLGSKFCLSELFVSDQSFFNQILTKHSFLGYCHRIYYLTKNSLIFDSKTSGSNGFVKYASAPTSLPSSMSFSCVFAENSMMGIFAYLMSLLSSPQTL